MSALKQRIELASVFKLVKVVAAAHMGGSDEDLRDGGAAIGARDHLGAHRRGACHVEFDEVHSLVAEQLLGRYAVGTKGGGIDLDRRHSLKTFARRGGRSCHYMGVRTAATTRANTSTSTDMAPARSNARAHVSIVAPEVSTSSTSTSRLPWTAASPPAGTRNAPCTLAARSARDRPTCWAVARTRLTAWDTGTPHVSEITWASTAAWLNRRAHSRRQCSGTGTRASALPRTSRPARAIHWPMVVARSSRSPYLSACTRSRATSSKRTAARARP